MTARPDRAGSPLARRAPRVIRAAGSARAARPLQPVDREAELDAIAAEAGRTARLVAVTLAIALLVTAAYDLVTGGPGLGVMVGW